MKISKNTIFVLIGFAILLLFSGWIILGGQPTANGTVPQENQDLVQPNLAAPRASQTATQASITNTYLLGVKARTLTPKEVSVTQGDAITLLVTTDEAGEFHIPGYNIEQKMNFPGSTEIKLTADKAGRYNFELHPAATGEDLEVGAFIVNPK